MQEQQSTSVSNVYFNLISVAYHSLQSAQTTAAYVRDAQQSGDQELVRFFEEYQRDTNKHAERARQLLSRLGQLSR
jgi:rubrerythrin